MVLLDSLIHWRFTSKKCSNVRRSYNCELKSKNIIKKKTQNCMTCHYKARGRTEQFIYLYTY